MNCHMEMSLISKTVISHSCGKFRTKTRFETKVKETRKSVVDLGEGPRPLILGEKRRNERIEKSQQGK